MRFSVVVPVYNVAEYLESCTNSVLHSDYRDFEMILVDDGSTDGVCPDLCDAIAQKYPDTVRVIHQLNMGLGGARNTGLEQARGDYLLFLDSDDTLAPSPKGSRRPTPIFTLSSAAPMTASASRPSTPCRKSGTVSFP